MGFCLVRSEQGGGSGDSAMSYEKYTSTQLSQILQFIGVRPWESILMAGILPSYWLYITNLCLHAQIKLSLKLKEQTRKNPLQNPMKN